ARHRLLSGGVIMIKENYEQKKNKIGEDVIIIAVTKYNTVEETLKAHKAGVRNFGENSTNWFIKRTNALKAKHTVQYIGTRLARKIYQAGIHVVNCFIQVNISDETSKHGLKPEEVEGFIEKLKAYKYVKVIGLMTMAPNTEDISIIENTFKGLKKLRENIVE